VPIDQTASDDERGTGYDYQSDTILNGFTVPSYDQPLHIAEPFSYQVAGHDPFLKARRGLLCKPAIPRELWFYLLVNQNYSHYLPLLSGFLGCVEFSREDLQRFAESVKGVGQEEKYITPWAEKIHQGHLKRMNKVRTLRARYLVLRDLTAPCERPCIMDLKMGRRAHGDDASEAKKASQNRKAKQTTSWSTGVRICGCQGYSLDYNEFWQMHKYEGRKLTAENLPLAFERYFHNGQSLRRDAVESVLQQAREIERVVERGEFRFYSTSLLLVYDGRLETSHTYLKMIDFAHTFERQPEDIIDDGYLFGLQTLIGILEQLLELPVTEENQG